MYPYSNLLPPLGHNEFYILLVLAGGQSHVYAIKSEIIKSSLGSVHISDGRLSAVIIRLHDDGLIELAGDHPAGKSGKLRKHYQISQFGIIRLQEEYQRLSHALKIIESVDIVRREIPTDIQRLLLAQAE